MLARHAKERETLRYPAEIVRWLEDQGDAQVNLATVSKILKKFEQRGWVTSRIKSPGSEMKFYTLTHVGRREFCELCIKAQQQIAWMTTSMVEGLAESARSEYDR